MSDKWKVGFSKAIITPDDYQTTKYYSAGYSSGVRCTEVLSDMYVRVVYFEANKEKVVIAEIDCVGMSNKDVLDIREMLADFIKENGTSINVCFTHCHSAADTQGLWGKMPKSGRVEKYNDFIKQSTAKTVMEAVKNAKTGKIFWGDIKTENIIEDTREPIVFDPYMTRLRFVPDDVGEELYIIHLGVHPEMLGPWNPKISADFPSFMGEHIRKEKGAEFMFINGAIGGQIVVPNLDGIYDKTLDNVEECKKLGLLAGEYALAIKNEKELKPHIRYQNKPFWIPITNIKFVLAKKAKLINNTVKKVSKKKHGYKYMIRSEISYLELGDIKIILIPGELAPELAMGGYLPKELSANFATLDENETIFAYMGKAEKKLVIGLANDEIGYILPSNDFFTHKWLPYIFQGVDYHGRRHYEETNSTGRLTADTLLNECKKLLENRDE